jgi:hypothetical protein
MKKLLSVTLALTLFVALAGMVSANSNSMTIVSDTSVMVYGPLTSYAPLGDPAWGTAKPAMITWKHPSWPLIGGSSAQWISTSYYIGDANDGGPVATSTWRWFSKSVDLCTGAYNIAGTIKATSDNAEDVYVNGNKAGYDGEVQGTPIDNHEWNTIIDYPFTVDAADTLILDFIVRNYPGSSSSTANPTGLFFEATVNYDCPIQVDIDIKPGSDPSCFNNDGNGVIPVAILGSTDFDVALIDAGTVQLEGLAVAARGKANKLLAAYEDVNFDGFDDLVVKIEDIDGTFTQGSGTAILTGSLQDGTPFFGTGDICITQP